MSLPAQIGRYHVLGHLASGGMAEIFLGKLLGPSGFERPVVIKRVLPGLSRKQAFLDMFLDEAKVVSRISHPNVVAVQELGRDDDGLYMVMEYLQGETVLGLMRRLARDGGTVDLALAAHLVEQAAAGLHAAHELRSEDGEPLGLVHRDVSPSNVMISYDGAVKVLDFGIAKFEERMTDTEAGLLKGKFAYMSPEQCASERDLDRRSDIFSLGILLFEISTGRRLFAKSTSLATMKAITEEPVPSVQKLVPDYPDSLARICARALSRERADRYPTAAAMRADLVSAIRELAPGTVPEMALAELMQATFADRIEAKAELLRRVRAGVDLTQIPEPEVDVSVELPTAFSTAGGGTPMAAPVRARSRWPVAAAISVLAIGIGLTAGLVFGADDDPDDGPAFAASDSSSDRSNDRGALADDPAADPIATEDRAEGIGAGPDPLSAGDAIAADPASPVAAPVHLAVTSTPPGASVEIDGEARGQTPLSIELARAQAPVTVRVVRPGYRPHEASFTPTDSGLITATLARSRARRPPPRAPSPSPADRSDPFRRFN